MSASELGLAALIFLSVSVLLFVAVQGTHATLGRQRTVFEVSWQ